LKPAAEETFAKRSILSKVKEDEDLALTLHCVQPEEYFEYFEDSAKLHFVRNLSLTQRLGKRGGFAKVS